MAPFTERAEISVREHLLDIRHRRSHTTVEGVEGDVEETNFSHEWHLVCQFLVWRHIKVTRFASVGCHLKFLRAQIASRCPSDHHG